MNELPKIFIKAVIIPAAIVIAGLLYAGIRYFITHKKEA